MAGRSFRKAGYDASRNQAGIAEFESAENGDTGTVHETDAGNLAEDRIEFEPAQGQETTSYTDGLPIEPNSIGDAEPEPVRRRRGRQKGSKNKTATRVTFSSQGNLEKLMLSAHMMAAAFLKTPELRIDAEESALLSKATLDVMKAYGVPELSDKQLAASQMIMAIGTVYAPRVMLVMHRKGQKPKLVSSVLPFPAGAGKAVQDAQPPMAPTAQQNSAAVASTFGVAPVAPPAQQTAPMTAQTGAATNGYVSSQVFASDPSTNLDTINAS